jgi:hypothetical protein
MIRDRRGAALVLVLIAMLIGTALAHGVLVLARAEGWLSRVHAATAVRARVERIAMDRALRGGVEAARTTPVQGVWSVPDSAHGEDLELRMRRLGREAWWMEAVDGPAGVRRAGSPARLLWWMDPVARVESLPAVVTVPEDGIIDIEGPVETLGFGIVETPLSEERCTPEPAGRFFGLVPLALGSPVPGTPATTLALLSLEALLDAPGAMTVEGEGTVRPVDVSDRCVVEDPWNWGDPLDASEPCGDHVAVVSAPADLGVRAGAGQAAVAVRGDLVLDGDARVYGFVVVGGTLHVLGRAELHGMAVVGRGIRVAPEARIRGSACWAVGALRAAAGVWAPRPLVVPGLPPIGP